VKAGNWKIKSLAFIMDVPHCFLNVYGTFAH